MCLDITTLIARVTRTDAVLWSHTIRVTWIDPGRLSDMYVIDDQIEHAEE
jgi:hypothetical protein